MSLRDNEQNIIPEPQAISRRSALRKIAFGVGGLTFANVLAACSASLNFGDSSKSGLTADEIKKLATEAGKAGAQDIAVNLKQQGDDIPKGPPPKGPEPAPTAAKGAEPAATPATSQVSTKFCADTESLPLGKEVAVGLVAATGIPDRIDAGPVEVADGSKFKFRNPLWRSIFAEPGGLWSEPGDEDIKAARRASNGAIQTFNPMQQEVVGTHEYCWNLAQGGFNVFTSDRLSLEIERTGIRIDLKQVDPARHIHYMAIRGFYPDPVNKEDRNRQVHLFGFKSGFVQALRMEPLPSNQNVAFLSEGQLFQFIETMVGGKESSRTNCGSADCTNATITLLDVNTKALRVIRNVTAVNNNGELAFTNWEK